MADNVSLNPMSGGATVRAVSKGGYEAQVIVIDLGGAGAESLLTGAMPVSGTFWQATQPVSGTVTVNAGTGTFGVSGSVAVSNFPATQPVSGTFWQATQPVSIATTVTVTGAGGTFPVTGTVAATQSGTWNVGSITTLPALAADEPDRPGVGLG